MDFTAVNDVTSPNLFKPGETVSWSLAGEFTGSAVLESSENPVTGGWAVIQTLSSATSSTFKNEGLVRSYRIRCTAIGEAETITAAMSEVSGRVIYEWYDADGNVRFQITDSGAEVEGSLAVSGGITGALTGSVTGTHTGNASLAATAFSTVEMTESATVPSTASFVTLNHATVAIAATALTPTRGVVRIIQQTDAGTAGHTVTTAGTFDGTNNTATFDAANETLVLLGLSSTRWAVLLNLGSVGLSAV